MHVQSCQKKKYIDTLPHPRIDIEKLFAGMYLNIRLLMKQTPAVN